MKPHVHIAASVLTALCLFFAACGNQESAGKTAPVENLYDDSISTSYTISLPDRKGEGLRMTYTFFNMKRADTGNFKMTHIYMHHTGEEDTTIVNGTWKLNKTDSGNFISARSGRIEKILELRNPWDLFTMNTDSTVADTGWLHLRQKKDNKPENSTVLVCGKVVFGEDMNATFLDQDGDSIPILKISAFRDLLALNDSVNLNSPGVEGVELLGTFQIRMAMDGRSIQRSLIVEEVGDVRRK